MCTDAHDKIRKDENRTEILLKQIQGEGLSLCQSVEAVSATACKQNHLENVWMIYWMILNSLVKLLYDVIGRAYFLMTGRKDGVQLSCHFCVILVSKVCLWKTQVREFGVCVSWQTQMAGGQRGRWAKWTGSSKGQFWLRGSDCGTNPAQSRCRYRTQVWVTLLDTRGTHTQTHTVLHIFSPKAVARACVYFPIKM